MYVLPVSINVLAIKVLTLSLLVVTFFSSDITLANSFNPHQNGFTHMKILKFLTKKKSEKNCNGWDIFNVPASLFK